MKRFLYLLTVITGFSISLAGQNRMYYEQFKNEKLGIFHTVKGDRDATPGDHYLLFENYTNNNIRVTYKTTVRVFGVNTTGYKDFKYTNTVYIKPKDNVLDFFWDDPSVKKYMISVSGNQMYNIACRVLLIDFELINYGVEQKNYETSF